MEWENQDSSGTYESEIKIICYNRTGLLAELSVLFASMDVPVSAISAHTLKDNTKAVNYDISYVKGTLTVTDGDLSVTIVVNDKTKTYDGTEYTGYTISSVTGTGETITTEDYTVTGLANGDVMTVAYTPKTGTDAAEYGEGTFGTITIKHGEVDVTDSYNISKTAGKLTINPVEIVLTAKSDEKPYDGTPLTNDGYDITTEFKNS